MLRKIITAIILIPLAIIIVMFAVANREIVTVSFDPFSSVNPAFAMTMPLFMLVLVLVGLGIFIGGVAAWLKQHKWRTRARRAEAEARVLREQILAERAQPALPVASGQVRMRLPPAA